ncbi:hypothetical protein QJQ45_013482 [Haematococcus lacustris]|nr:hypothetical protein QJQ45_013482 [Haematococcus lacustris]
MKPQLADSYSFRLCWSWSCLGSPESFDAAAEVTIVAAAVPMPAESGGLAGGSWQGSFLAPSCASIVASITLTSPPATEIPLRGSMVDVPSATDWGITYVISTRANCDNQHAAAMVSRAYPSLPQPVAPRSSCACAAVPGAGGACSGALVLVTLTTLSAAEGQSLRQCVDPGHFDFSTGNFAFSYCWRYACLSPTFASSDFTATVTDLDRFNVKNMEAGAQYNATIKATAGVVVRVTAQPKEAGASALMFNNTGASSNAGGSFSGNVTSPPSGISSFTLVITVPVGFDDLSTTVAMELYPGQYLPPAPPAPPGSLCRCPSEPDALGACSEGETLALVTRPGSNVTMAQCLYLPSYDVFQQQLVFSTCWRWACFSLAFRGPTSPDTIKPYTITLTNVTKTYNLDKMPGGLFRLQVLKPTAVNMSVSVYGPGPSPSTFGPWSSTAEVVLPPSTSAMDIVIDVPNLDFVDGSRGAIIFQPSVPLPASPAPTATPPRPPFPPSSVAANATLLVASFYVLRLIPAQADLDSILANISSYLLTLPLGFTDFSTVPDCSTASRLAFSSNVASSLGLPTNRVSATCHYGATLQRRRGRALAQICNEAVQLTPQINFDPAAARAVGLTNLAGLTSSRLSNTFGNNLCGFGQPVISTGVVVSQTQTRTGSVSSQCSALAASLEGVSSRDVANLQCSSLSSGPLIVAQPPGGPDSGGGPPAAVVAASGSSTNVALLGGAVGGGVGGALLIALVAISVIVVMRRRKPSQSVAPPPAASAAPRAPAPSDTAGDRQASAAGPDQRLCWEPATGKVVHQDQPMEQPLLPASPYSSPSPEIVVQGHAAPGTAAAPPADGPADHGGPPVQPTDLDAALKCLTALLITAPAAAPVPVPEIPAPAVPAPAAPAPEPPALAPTIAPDAAATIHVGAAPDCEPGSQSLLLPAVASEGEPASVTITADKSTVQITPQAPSSGSADERGSEGRRSAPSDGSGPTEVVPGLNREVVPHDDAKFFSNWGPWHKVDKEDLASLQALVPPLPGVFEWGAQPPGAAADNLSILAFYLGKADGQEGLRRGFRMYAADNHPWLGPWTGVIFWELQRHGFSVHFRWRVCEDVEPEQYKAGLLQQLNYAANSQLNGGRRQIQLPGNRQITDFPIITEED